ncbi:MAG: hypothetical protein ACTS68_01225 [Candidatus Hodgkinia cicadicola]
MALNIKNFERPLNQSFVPSTVEGCVRLRPISEPNTFESQTYQIEVQLMFAFGPSFRNSTSSQPTAVPSLLLTCQTRSTRVPRDLLTTSGRFS